jgi:hypothetical protein
VGEKTGDKGVDGSIIIRSVVCNKIANAILDIVFMDNLFYDLGLVLTRVGPMQLAYRNKNLNAGWLKSLAASYALNQM